MLHTIPLEFLVKYPSNTPYPVRHQIYPLSNTSQHGIYQIQCHFYSTILSSWPLSIISLQYYLLIIFKYFIKLRHPILLTTVYHFAASKSHIRPQISIFPITVSNTSQNTAQIFYFSNREFPLDSQFHCFTHFVFPRTTSSSSHIVDGSLFGEQTKSNHRTLMPSHFLLLWIIHQIVSKLTLAWHQRQGLGSISTCLVSAFAFLFKSIQSNHPPAFFRIMPAMIKLHHPNYIIQIHWATLPTKYLFGLQITVIRMTVILRIIFFPLYSSLDYQF